MKRLSGAYLEELSQCLTDRDKAILESLQKCRYLTSGQIQRLHFADHANPAAGLRAANRVLTRLKDSGIIKALSRQIGGVRGGSKAYVWQFTEAGVRLMFMNGKCNKPRKTFFEPAPFFLKHTVEVADVYVQLTEICTEPHANLLKVELEPVCWRRYTDENGRPATLKPDMFAVVDTGDYEYSWFIERDLNNEAPAVVMEKCRRYTLYYMRNIERVFPQVLWVVPDPARKRSIQKHIDGFWELQHKSMFTIITPDEFKRLILEGADALTEKGETA
ncbi:MAG: replication-relaxation family protein [Oscillospiraceae bacterium]|nr:replication-relaxation family protein [Oscillospiraceae bacterium]